MRLLLISWEYAPVIEGGLGRHVTTLAERLADRDGYEVHVLSRGPEPADEVRNGVHVHRVAMDAFSLGMDQFMAWVGQLNAKLAQAGAELEGRFDLIHSHDWLVAGAAEQIAIAGSTPWLVTVHATEFGRHGGWVHLHPQRAIHLTERHMVRAAAHVITCSEYMRGQVCRVFGVPAERVVAIPNGIDAADLAVPKTAITTARERYGAGDAPLVMMIGRLVYEKGFQVALEALARVQPTPHWLLAGSGPEAENLARQADALGLSDAGRLLGRIDDSEMHALFHLADLAVIPSLYEPFGIVPLEAMACGTAVVCSDAGGLREVVGADGRAGLRVPAGNVGALADAITTLVGDPARRNALARAGRAHVTGFSWDAITTQTVEVYDALTAVVPA